MLPRSDTIWITDLAREIGFDLCGVAPAVRFPELERLPEWLARGYAGEMRYLEDPRRADPARVLPGVKSVIVCALNYNTAQPYSTHVPPAQAPENSRGWVSRYAWGDDYHDVIGQKLEHLVAALPDRFTESFEARWYVDTGPIVERVAARHAGLGWLGKNTLLINEQLGSWLFLGTILTTLELAPSLGVAEAPPADLCGSCRLCLDACPTEALVEPYVLDARRCISYLTIELRGEIPLELREPMGRYVFGCDICQDVCPWNRRAPVTELVAFQPRPIPSESSATDEKGDPQEETMFHPQLEWLALLSEEEFRSVFRGSPVKRAKWRGLVRNACIAQGNSGLAAGTTTHARIGALLVRLASSSDSVIAASARWALSRIP